MWNSALREKFDLCFSRVFASVDKILILGGRLDNRPPLYEVMRFIQQLVYTMLINNNPTLFHLWWKENLVKYLKHFLKHAGFKWLKSSPSFSVFTLFEVYITGKFILRIVLKNHSYIIYLLICFTFKIYYSWLLLIHFLLYGNTVMWNSTKSNYNNDIDDCNNNKGTRNDLNSLGVVPILDLLS